MAKIELNEHFNYRKLLRFTLPSIAMMVFISIYSVVDGVFISRFAGEVPFASINLVMPIIMVLSCFGFMFGVGGSALVSKKLGEGDQHTADRYFTMIVEAAFATGLLLTLLGEIFLEPLAKAIGAKGELLEDALIYGRIMVGGVTCFLMQNVFSSLMVVALKQRLALRLTIAAGLTNMVGDAVFVGLFRWGVAGAACASILGQFIGGVIPFIYFLSHKGNPAIRLVRTKFEFKPIGKACWNGVSELSTNLAGSLVSVCFNMQFMRLMPHGEDGVSAYGFIMYVSFIFMAIFFGFSMGSSPIISYNYGAKNSKEIQNVVKKSAICIGVASLVMFGLSVALNIPLSTLFLSPNEDLVNLGKHAFFLFSFSFLTCGYNVYASSLFTAYNNGLISAIISLLRTMVFSIACVFILPLFMGVDGLWITPIVADILTLIVSEVFLLANDKRYHYFRGNFPEEAVEKTK